ncbi:MAG: response regulator receiver domain/Rubrerythrin [Deltaproteobacteria bacterium]|nr:response regulator receiver domain/Rubrerythrin [Deltaproteobacteria bacterium]
MNSIVEWLMHIEEKAESIYERSADIFIDDKEFSEFLRQLSSEESYHKQVALDVSECIKKMEQVPDFKIAVDDETMKRIELPFIDIEKKIGEGRVTKADVFDFIITAELSEWNDIFLYIVDSFRGCSSKIIPIVAKIQQHKRSIERLIEQYPNLLSVHEKLRKLRPVWKENLLIVDDSEAIVALLSLLLENEGTIDHAYNGKKALEKMAGKYYSAVVMDVEMPLMSGIDFYKEAIKLYPNLQERILFYSSADDSKNISFFRENNLKYLIKPADIRDIIETVGKILNR